MSSVRETTWKRHCTQHNRALSVYSRGRSVYHTIIISDQLPDDQPRAERKITVEDLGDDILCRIIEFFNLNVLLEISFLNENQWTAPIEKALPRVFQLNFPLLRVDVVSLWNAHGVWPKKYGRGPFRAVERTFSLTRHFQSMMRLSSTSRTSSSCVADQWPDEEDHNWLESKGALSARLKEQRAGQWHIHVCYVCERTFRCVNDKHDFVEEDNWLPEDGGDKWFLYDEIACDCLKRNVRKEVMMANGELNNCFVNTSFAACSNDCFWMLRENLELLSLPWSYSSGLPRPPFWSRKPIIGPL